MRVLDVRLVVSCVCGWLLLSAAGCGGSDGEAASPAQANDPVFTISVAASKVSAVEGSPVSFLGNASHSGTASYQWLRNGVAIAGATAGAYTLPAATMADNGAQFSLMISSSGGPVISGAATLTVMPTPLSIIAQPVSMQGQRGGVVTLSAVVRGNAQTMQWQRSDDGGANWRDIANATQASLTMVNLSFADALMYRLVVSNATEKVIATPAMVTVRPSLRLLAGAVGGAGYVNGALGEARFSSPTDAVVTADGTIIVNQGGDYSLRKIAPNGVAGSYFDGYGVATPAPGTRLLIDPVGNIYYGWHHAVFQLRADDRTPHLLAGAADAPPGVVDGEGADARFVAPANLALDADGNIFVADYDSGSIRKITPAGVVSTLFGAPRSRSARVLRGPDGIAVGANGELYIADQLNNVIRRLSPNGALTTVAGQKRVVGVADGAAGASQLRRPGDLAYDSRNNILYLIDWNTVRKLDASGQLSTLAGGAVGYADGAGAAASFGVDLALTLDNDGNVIITDRQNHVVRRMTPAGVVSTLSGIAPVRGAAEGQGGNARFNVPVGVARGRDGTVYVADELNHVIRKVDMSGNVSVHAGRLGDPSLLAYPQHLTIDADGNLYVTALSSGTIFKIRPDGGVARLAQIDASGNVDEAGAPLVFDHPRGISGDAAGNLYILDAHGIAKVTPARGVSPVATFGNAYADGEAGAAGFAYVSTLVSDGVGNLYITDNCTLRKITPEGAVATVAGSTSFCGSSDGLGSNGLLTQANAIALDGRGYVYIADATGVRRVSPAGYVTTLIQDYGGFQSGRPRIIEKHGVLLYANATGGLTFTADGRLIMASENAILLAE